MWPLKLKSPFFFKIYLFIGPVTIASTSSFKQRLVANFIEFITKYNSKNATVILNNLSNHTEILMSKDRFIRGDILKEDLGVNKKFKENELIKQKLDILQNYAKMKNINIRKAGKTGKINVKKDELITLICNN